MNANKPKQSQNLNTDDTDSIQLIHTDKAEG